MENKKPLLSICIPTKNRELYCIEAIKDILSNDNRNFELVIHDHSDSKIISDYVNSITDLRLKYFYTDLPISSSENMSKSIELATGKYICMIGDDDTVLDSIFDVVLKMEQEGIDSIASDFRPEFIWPYENDKGQTLEFVKLKYSQSEQEINCYESLMRLSKNGMMNYQIYNLPRVYHGIIRSDKLHMIFKKVETFFAGLSPDIYSSVALSGIVKKHIIVNYPFTISGACINSTTIDSKERRHSGKIENAPHLRNRHDYKWDISIPPVYSVETIWAESAIKALKDFKYDKILRCFNNNVFLNTLFFNNRELKNLISDNVQHKEINFIFKWYIVSNIYMSLNYAKRGFIKIFYKKSYYFQNIKNFEQCKLILKNYYRDL